MKTKHQKSMKILVNNPFKYFLGRYIFPTLGIIFNVVTFLFFFDKTYFYFFHYNSLCVLKDLLKLDKQNIVEDHLLKYFVWRKHTVYLWYDLKVSIHSDNECIISSYAPSKWVEELLEKIYLKQKN